MHRFEKAHRSYEHVSHLPESGEVVQDGGVQSAVNAFISTHENGVVNIKLGSTHSSKGQIHTATVVLETFNYERLIASLLPLAAGQNSNGEARPGKRTFQRLLAMVAMTRPTHLLCLAIGRRALGEGEAFKASYASRVGTSSFVAF